MKKDFVCIETLGKGSFGVVQLMKENRTDKLSAWKEMKYQTHKDKQLVDSEVNIMRNIYKYLSDQASKQNSPFVSIIKPLGGFENKDNDTYVLILEYCSMGDLRKFINETKELINEDRVWNFTGQIASAIHQLHMINIVHKDIKPENILINENFHLKLADFGLSQHLQDNQITLKTDGTPLQQTLATDIWAFGITLCELITQKHPFFEDMKSQHVTLEMLIQKLQQKQLLQIQGSFSDNLKSLVKKMLENKHEDRITAGQIVTIPEIVDILMPKKSNLKQENNIKSKETEEKEKENKQNESE
ncbi:MAG: putative NEK protein kinase [Streblomastix strix]|uniref:Putative NEK protein kinase n=1 Tax=Streblomastix strix TaxID=222440 RepID=A0A5J4WKL2_9EUKA|nr:MAG: putative NEK protein kinase [Streblomastix strix]